MTELRRQGVPHKEIAARAECSERTVGRWLGDVPAKVEVPRGEPQPDVEPDRVRASLMRWCTSLLQDEFNLCPSVTLVDEAVRRLKARLARSEPETLKLMVGDVNMRLQLFYEVVGPLELDLRRSDRTGRIGAGDPPVIWHPLVFPDEGTLTWQPPESDDEPSDDAPGKGEGLP